MLYSKPHKNNLSHQSLKTTTQSKSLSNRIGSDRISPKGRSKINEKAPILNYLFRVFSSSEVVIRHTVLQCIREVKWNEKFGFLYHNELVSLRPCLAHSKTTNCENDSNSIISYRSRVLVIECGACSRCSWECPVFYLRFLVVVFVCDDPLILFRQGKRKSPFQYSIIETTYRKSIDSFIHSLFRFLIPSNIINLVFYSSKYDINTTKHHLEERSNKLNYIAQLNNGI